MKELLRRLISLFGKGGKLKGGKLIVKNLTYTKQLKTIVNWERTDPGLFKTWASFPKSKQVYYLRQIKQGKLTIPQLKKEIVAYQEVMAPAKMNFTIKHGIQFLAQEILAIDAAAAMIQKNINNPSASINIFKGFQVKLGSKFKIRAMNPSKTSAFSDLMLKKGTQRYTPKVSFPGGHTYRDADITVIIVPYEHAKTIYPGIRQGVRGWDTGNPNSTVFYLVWEQFSLNALKTSTGQLADIKKVMTHEIAHLKDPSTIASPKLSSNYDSNAPYWDNNAISLAKWSPKNWKKNYYYHQWEIAANLAPILKSITSNTQTILKSAGKEKTLAALNQLLQWTSQGTEFTMWTQLRGKLGTTATYILTGTPAGAATNVDIVRFFDQFKQENPAEYKKVIYKLARQLESLKKQVTNTKHLTPESVIKLKTLI